MTVSGQVAPAGTAPRSRRGLIGVLAAQAVAWTGTRFSSVALPWFVLTSTGSVVQTGTVVFAQLLPYVVAQTLAGPLIDRVGPRRVSIAGDLVAGAAMAAVPALYWAGALPLPVLLALIAVVGAADGPANAAKSVFIPAVTRAAQVPLERGTGLAGTLERLAATAGPAAAGFVVAAVGGVPALLVTAVLLATGSVIIVLAIPGSGQPADPDRPDGYLAQFRQGVSFLRRERLLRSITGMVAVTNLLDAAVLSVVLPVWAYTSGHGPAAVGLVLSVMSGCAAATSVLAAAIGHRLPRRAVYLGCFLIAGAPRFLALAFGFPLWVVLAVHVVSGFGTGFVNPILSAVMFERIPETMLGRVRSLIGALAWSGMPFGGLVGGGLIAVAGFAPAVLVLGGCYLVATLLPGLRREWAEMDATRAAGSPSRELDERAEQVPQ